MKTLKSLLVLLAMALMAACDKNDTDQGPDLPCFGSFSCEINGEPFETSGSASCPSKYFSYDSINNLLIISGSDCRVYVNGIAGVVLHVHNIDKIGTYPIWGAAVEQVDNQARPFYYDSILSGNIQIKTFIETDYSDSWKGGVIEGTFDFISWSESLNDTVYVTNGRFCGRI